MMGWSYRPFGELIESLDARRQPVKEADRRPGPYPYYGASGVVDHVDGYLFEGLHLLVAEDGENLRTRKLPIAFLADGRFWVNNHAHVVRGNAHADTRFLSYALMVADVASYLSGSTMPKLTQGNLHRVPIYAPELGEQIAIADTLASMDHKIDLNRRTSETLEAMAQAIFRDWFVDFGPVRRKMEGATDPVAIMGGLTPDPVRAADLARRFPEAFDEDERPQGWAPAVLSDLARHCKGSVTPLARAALEFEHYSLPAFDSGQEPAIDLGASIKSNKTPVPGGAVLLSKLNPEIPRVWLPNPAAGRQQIASTEFLIFQPLPGIGRGLLYCLFRDPTVRQILSGMVTGTSKSHQRISPPALMKTTLLISGGEALNAFDQLVEPLLQRVLSLRAENRTLAETRDYLLPRLMSGQVRVRATPASEEATA